MTLPVQIVTDRLLLRKFTIHDLDDVLTYANNPNFSRFLPPVPYPYTRKDAAEFIARRIVEDWTQSAAWAVTLNGRAYGGVSLRFKNENNTLAEMGWSIAEEQWGKGIMTEAATAVRDAAFHSSPEFNKAYARADILNVGSWRVMEKIGMQREALLRQHEKHNGVWQDDVWYAILRSEWEELIS